MKKPRPGSDSRWSLAGATVVVSRDANEVARWAAGELSRCLHLLTGRTSPVSGSLPARGSAVVLDPRVAEAMGVRAVPSAVGPQGFRLVGVGGSNRRCVVIAAASPRGLLYGAYGLLERLGMGFYAGGETFPDRPAPAEVPAALDVVERPAFAVRGNMLHYNFLCGCTGWGLEDYRFYFDQLARMRCNMLLMHWYDSEPGAAWESRGEYRAGGSAPNSLSRPWGALSALRTSEFSFGAGRFFGGEIYSSPMGEDLPDLLAEVKRSEAMFREATRYARGAGIEVAAGFEAPRGDPEDREVAEGFRERLRQFLERNPNATRFALWEHESGGCVGLPPPPAGSGGAALLAKRRDGFSFLGNEQRVWEAIRFGRFAEIAVSVLEREAPRTGLVLVGWGGDRWMQFADYCLAYDRTLPPQVAFTCHDNIEASMGDEVSTPWGQLSPTRERWAMPWVEGDIDECLVRQPNVEALGRLAPDALRKGCQGLLTLQWRTRDVEEETGYIARFAWDPTLTPARFYRRLASDAFGPDQARRMGRHLATLQRLGARWTGVRGSVECGRMHWCGSVPHFPFEVDGGAALFLADKAAEAASVLAEIPAAADGEAAFHLLAQGGGEAPLPKDGSRLGVRELSAAAKRLRAFAGEEDAGRLRAVFSEIAESIYELRPRLVAAGMSSRAYRAVDGFLIPIHHLRRNAGAKGHMATLRRIRRDLGALEGLYRRQKRVARLERLDYLAATIDFVMPYDSAAMLLADGEAVEQALALAGQTKGAGDPAGAAGIAASAYSAVVAAGIHESVAALARKLTTRCDFGTMATFQVKQLGLYWQSLARLEDFLPAVPPREIRARGRKREAWISWVPGPRTEGQNLYRRPQGAARWQRVNRRPLAAGCQMFRDRPPIPGAYEYSVASLDREGWESPRSHPARVTCGTGTAAPRIVACKPCSRFEAGEPWLVRVAVVSDRDLREVALGWRMVGRGGWRRVRMSHAFRETWVGELPAGVLSQGTLQFFVEARDEDGGVATWPASAPSLPWSVVVGRVPRRTTRARVRG